MKLILTLIAAFFLAGELNAQNIKFVKDETMNNYMLSGLSNKKFKPSGKTKNDLKVGKWKDYKVQEDYAYCYLNELPTQVFGHFLLYSEGEYIDGKRNGEWIFYTIEDKSFKKILHKKVNFIDGVEEGRFQYFYPTGELGVIGELKDGKLEGEVLSYYPNGHIYGNRKFKNGKEDGKHTYVYADSTLKLVISFKDGIRNGEYCLYYSNGNVKEKLTYKLGKEDGIYQYYYENGQLWIEKVFEDGLLMEVNGSYAANGEERNKGTISNGNGTVNYFTENGKIYHVQTYKDGVKIKEEDR